MINFVMVLILVLFSLISYTILLYSARTYRMASDYTFFFYKLAIILAVIGMGYFSTLFSLFHEYVPKIYGQVAVVRFFKILKYFDYPFMIISCMWLTVAIALLPYGPVVVHNDTETVDQEKTAALYSVYQAVYVYPFVIMLVVFFLNATIFLAACGDHTSPYNQTKINLDEVYRKFRTINPMFGFYFNTDAPATDPDGGDDASSVNLAFEQDMEGFDKDID